MLPRDVDDLSEFIKVLGDAIRKAFRDAGIDPDAPRTEPKKRPSRSAPKKDVSQGNP